MAFELSLIRALQTISGPFMDYLMYGLTQMGDELFFMALALIVYWCIDKRFGFKLINVYLVSAAFVEGVKMLAARPRPYTRSGIRDITNEFTQEYTADAMTAHADRLRSMPSGHTHSVANLGTQLSFKYRKKWLYIVTIAVVVVVAFSRMYLGMHHLTDVLTGAAMGVGLALGLSVLFELLKNREHYIVFVALPACLIIAILIAALGLDVSENVYKVLGVYPALAMGYYAEKRFVKLNVRTSWYKNVFKVGLGGLLVLVFWQGLKFVMFQVEDLPFVYHFLRYFLVGIMATIGAMELFKLFKLYDAPLDEAFHIPPEYIEGIDEALLRELSGTLAPGAKVTVTVTPVDPDGDEHEDDEEDFVPAKKRRKPEKLKKSKPKPPDPDEPATDGDATAEPATDPDGDPDGDATDPDGDPLDRTLEELSNKE